MTDFETEVVIVGGGPGGSAAAFTLASRGFRVILIDRKQRENIGDKVCGDALSPNYTEKVNNLVGLPVPDPEYALKCDHFVIEGTHSKLVVPSNSGTVERRSYGQQLIDAIDSYENATIMDQTRLIDVIIEEEKLRGIVCLQGTDKFTIRADLVIDASGTTSIVRKKMPPSLVTKMGSETPREMRFVAYREIIRTPEPHNYQDSLYIMNQKELEDLGASYYWVFSKGERLLNVGLGYLISQENRGHKISELNRQITDRLFPDAEVLRSQGDQIPARLPLPSCVADNFVVVGDAAGLANPLNGEGHGPALLAGCHAGLTIASALEQGDCSENNLWSYNQYIWEEFGKLSSWGIAVIRLMNKQTTKLYDNILDNRLISQHDISTIISDTSKTPSVWTILKRGWKKPGLLWDLYKTKKYAESIRKLIDEYPENPQDNFEAWREKIAELEDYYR